MSKTKTPIKNTSVPSAYDTPLTTLEYLRKVESQNAQVLARADEIEEALDGKVAKAGDTMTGTLNVPQVNANTGVFHNMNVVSQDEKTHVEADNNGFVAEVNVTDLNKKYGVIALPNGKVGFYAHDATTNKDVNFIIPNMDDYEAGTYELATKDDIPSGGSSLLEDIEDADGHKAFEMYSQDEAPEDTTPLYVKGIRNGNVLTLICFTSVSNAQNVTKTIGYIKLPSYILDKLILLQDGTSNIISLNTSGINAGTSYSQVNTRWYKESDGVRIAISGLSVFSGGTVRASITLGL